MMETQARTLRQSKLSVLPAPLRTSRVIATLGIVVMTVGLYLPYVGRDVIVRSDPGSRNTDTWAIGSSAGALPALLHVGRLSLPLQLGFDAVYSVLTLGGLALIPLLWRRLAPKGTTRVRWTYAVWLSLLTLLAGASLSAWWQFMSQPFPAPESQFFTVEAPYLLPGAAVFPLGVLINCAALSRMLREPLPAAVPPPASRTGWQWAATLVLTVGALVWGIGFYLMPEVITAACPPVSFSVTQFAHGACAGLDSDQVLVQAYTSDLNLIARMLYILGRHFEVLVAAGCITTLGGWTRRLSEKTLIWLAVWPVLAFGVALVALRGVGVVAWSGFQLTIATGLGWHMAPGMVVTFAGIVLVALGQLGLWCELIRRRR